MEIAQVVSHALGVAAMIFGLVAGTIVFTVIAAQIIDRLFD
jgi:hypothetical protein